MSLKPRIGIENGMSPFDGAEGLPEVLNSGKFQVDTARGKFAIQGRIKRHYNTVKAQVVPSSPGGRAMLILVPWKPVVIIWLVLSAMFFFSCVAQSLMEGQNPFLPRGFYISQVDHMGHIAHQRRYPHKPVEAAHIYRTLEAKSATN